MARKSAGEAAVPANWVSAANLMVSQLLRLSEHVVPGRVMNMTVASSWTTKRPETADGADELRRKTSSLGEQAGSDTCHLLLSLILGIKGERV